MSGFDAEWLTLREPVDARARSKAVLQVLRRWAVRHRTKGARPLRIHDLGAGTGSNMRLLAPKLPVWQAWTLLDDEPVLLAAAVRRDRAGQPAGSRTPWRASVRAETCDLSVASRLRARLCDSDLVTASALFDLVSAAWCRRLVMSVAAPGNALYVALTCDGRLDFSPADPLDAEVRALFARHQRSDKGFGPALGSAAAPALARLCAAAGANVRIGHSDWRLGPADAALLCALVRGWVGAACEVAPERAAELAAWADRRGTQISMGTLHVVVGHRDLLAIW